MDGTTEGKGWNEVPHSRRHDCVVHLSHYSLLCKLAEMAGLQYRLELRCLDCLKLHANVHCVAVPRLSKYEVATCMVSQLLWIIIGAVRFLQAHEMALSSNG